MTAADGYLGQLSELIGIVRREEAEGIERAATLAADSIRRDGVLHLFGAGHSQLVALEGFLRAGGLASVQVIDDPALAPSRPATASRIERLPGYAATLMGSSDLRAGEVLIVISNSGVNAVPVEVAQLGAARGAHVVAITSRQHTGAVPPRHPSGRRLADLAEIVIDTHAPVGDAIHTLSSGSRVGGVSTALGTAILTSVIVRTAELVEESGARAPVIESQNVPGGGEANAALVARYRDRRWSA